MADPIIGAERTMTLENAIDASIARGLRHRCYPPCQLDLMADHREARKRMTKAQLLADADQADEAWLNLSEEHSMLEVAYGDLYRLHTSEPHGDS